MPARFVSRLASLIGKAGLPNANSIRVDAATDTLRFGTGASGTTEKEVVDTSSTQTLTGKTLTGAVVAPIVPTVAFPLTAAMNGATIFWNAAAGFAVTLPALAAGLKFTFITAAAFATTNFQVLVPGGANLIFGGADVNSTWVPADAEDAINFVATAETIGDKIQVECDGTNWFVSGQVTAAGGVTFTAAL